ncbi:MAG: tripartite tricarboxylate transporter permease [Paracoccaceae bacterium]|jgi:TctA family transporter|nr:tripartite tricarboxylate transporter permease [Paracoccaceae bacterium]
MFEASLAGLTAILDPGTLLVIVFGVMIGLMFGVVPGLGGTVLLAVLIPFIYPMDAHMALAFLLASNAAVVFGGSITAILFNVPGTAQNIATCFDGYPMTQKGQSARALGISATASLIGGLFGVLVLTALIPLVRPILIYFGPAELFALTIFGLVIIAFLGEGSIVKGVIAGGFGLLLSFVGSDPITGISRFNLDQTWLLDGLDFVAVVIGVFAISQVIELYVNKGSIVQDTGAVDRGRSSVWEGVRDVLSRPVITLRSSALGAFIGIIPGVGGTVANILAYGQAMQMSKDRSDFGKGAVNGVLGPEASNNATDGGSLLPTLAFGIPGGEATAILLGAFILKGIDTGPSMLTENLDIVFVLVWAIAIANVIASLVGLQFALRMVRFTFLRGEIIGPFILTVGVVGAFAAEGHFSAVWVALAFGVLGYFMKKYGFPKAPLVIGLVLGIITERYLQISLRTYGDAFFLFDRPLALVLMIVALSVLVYPFATKIFGSRQAGAAK